VLNGSPSALASTGCRRSAGPKPRLTAEDSEAKAASFGASWKAWNPLRSSWLGQAAFSRSRTHSDRRMRWPSSKPSQREWPRSKMSCQTGPVTLRARNPSPPGLSNQSSSCQRLVGGGTNDIWSTLPRNHVWFATELPRTPITFDLPNRERLDARSVTNPRSRYSYPSPPGSRPRR
jgi:hypothetical protein